MVFKCRMCSEDPCAALFGKRGVNETPKRPDQRTRSERRAVQNFQPRDEQALKALVKSWEQYVHPRAREFFQTHDRLTESLMSIARNIHYTDDPILGGDSCVYWYGDVTKDVPEQAALRLVKPGEVTTRFLIAHTASSGDHSQDVESVTYVNRLLAFIFATDESFEKLMRLPKEPFKMVCGDQLCVNLKHIGAEPSYR
ncbi:hypothetical protein FOZ61_005378 [Perkinsus olseni]|uniref:Uncharacterized protein n=2 Tax=Perkinsus olseni TaxID=32597 RepID=A0A7J6MI49_PEROL|nr:hypothetical protein FOZ61_005378 [Perkinsus olseni]KAF4676594.1 hypothetical protein FOL46_000057 [Perkinsus olseni]